MKKILRMLKYNVSYFFSGNNGKFFNSLARKKLLPEQVDGYINKYADPIVNYIFENTLLVLKNNLNEEEIVLEIGCGTGRYLRGIKDSLKNKPYGIYFKEYNRIIYK